MRKVRLDRRTLLRGAGSIAIALPWLEAMGPDKLAHAQAPGTAKRFVTVYNPGGVVQEPQGPEGQKTQRFWPTGGETAFALSPILSSLEPVRQHVVLLRGLEMACAIGEQHAAGSVGWLTGAEQENAKNAGGQQNYSGMPSIDQVIAERVSKGQKRKASLQMAIRWATGYTQGLLNPANAMYFENSPTKDPISPALDPVAIFNDLFGQLDPSQAPGVEARIARQKSILDFVDKKYASLMQELGAADRAKLDQHLTKLRELEMALDKGIVAGGACQLPPLVDTSGYNPKTGVDSNVQGSIKDVETDAMIPVVGKFMMDMIVMALTCDITGVASLQWTDTEAKHTFPWLNLHDHHHFYQHDGGHRPAECEQILTWYWSQNAYLLQEMAKVDMGGHSLLDESVVLFGSELGWPDSHAKDNMPFVVAGGGGGLKGGRYLDFRMDQANLHSKGRPHNNLLVGILNLFGEERTTYNEPGRDHYCLQPIDLTI